MKKHIIFVLIAINIIIFGIGIAYFNRHTEKALADEKTSFIPSQQTDSNFDATEDTGYQEENVSTFRLLENGQKVWKFEYLDAVDLIVNKSIGVPEEYRPNDLVETKVSFVNHSEERNKLRKDAAEALEAMFEAAKQKGVYLVGVSGYRSYEKQARTYENSLRQRGEAHTAKYVAVPGTSEHQLGLAIDISSKRLQYKLINSFADTKEGQWLQENSYKYGFIMRYPEHKQDIVGYAYEPWHFRYVGIPLATSLYISNLTLEEYQETK